MVPDCCEKFVRYSIMDPAKVVKLCDEITVCVYTILGSTYNSEFEDVKIFDRSAHEEERGERVEHSHLR